MKINLKQLSTTLLVALTIAAPKLGHATDLEGVTLSELPNAQCRGLVIIAAAEKLYNEGDNPLELALLNKECAAVVREQKQVEYSPFWKAYHGMNPQNEASFEQYRSGVATQKQDDGKFVEVLSFRSFPKPAIFVHEGLVLTNSPLCTFAEIPGTEDFVVGALWHGQAIRLVVADPSHALAPIMDDWDGENCPFGLFFRPRAWKTAYGYYYLTAASPSEISAKNLYGHLTRSEFPITHTLTLDRSLLRSTLRRIQYFV